jgi:hypothetical protein
MAVTNNFDEPVTLIRAELITPQFTSPPVWERGTTLPPGVTVALRAHLTDPVCPIPDGATPTVRIEYETADGAHHTDTITPTQSTNSLETIGGDECIATLVQKHADMGSVGSVDWVPGAHGTATITIPVTPTDADGSMTIGNARSTVLLSIVDDTGMPTQELPVDLKVDASTVPTNIVLHVQPARCDQHVVIEDKRGTIFPFAVTTSEGVAGVSYVPSPDELKFSLYKYVGDYCGF